MRQDTYDGGSVYDGEEGYEPFVAESGITDHSFYTAVPKKQYQALMEIVKAAEAINTEDPTLWYYIELLVERLDEYKALLPKV